MNPAIMVDPVVIGAVETQTTVTKEITVDPHREVPGQAEVAVEVIQVAALEDQEARARVQPHHLLPAVPVEAVVLVNPGRAVVQPAAQGQRAKAVNQKHPINNRM